MDIDLKEFELLTMMGLSDEEFINSDFFRNWNDLLNSSKIIVNAHNVNQGITFVGKKDYNEDYLRHHEIDLLLDSRMLYLFHLLVFLNVLIYVILFQF